MVQEVIFEHQKYGKGGYYNAYVVVQERLNIQSMILRHRQKDIIW